jgi:FkbM family methyltransferase
MFKYFSKEAAFQRALLDTKRKAEGTINLFGNEFFYHYGLAFYNTYMEIFHNNIYEFNATNNSKPIIIDCGANMGLSVLYFSKKHPTAEIIAFEPDESVLPFLERNIQSQKINNVKLYKKGVWNEETELKFYTDNGLGGRVEKQYENQSPKIIKSVRLRDFLDTQYPIDMLKIDIEGAEYKVLQDCEGVLFNVDHIFIEYHSILDEEQHLEDILNIIKRQGFRYHLKESFSRRKPFVDNSLVCERFDMAINIFAYKCILNQKENIISIK